MIFFEHIIKVSIPALTSISLSKDDLWNGLVDHAHHPEIYIEHLEESSVLKKSTNKEGTTLNRKLNFGNFQLYDSVFLNQKDFSLLISVEPGENFGKSSLLMKIEEPEKNSLFVRFIYQEDEKQQENAKYDDLRKQAYEAKDKVLIEKLLQKICNQ